jgi:glyoxylase-like metal-dependent hydrolase (beta-lactamase superfamily II)
VKLLIKMVTASFLTVVVLALVFLLPAHLQVRAVSPALPSEASLRALLQVDNAPVRVSYISTSSQRSSAGVLGHNSVLVEWDNGDIVMIDAGMDEAQAREFGDLMKTVFGGEDPIVHGTISQLLGEDIDRVKAVGFTHLHIDHTQGLSNFCNARGTGAVGLQLDYQRELHNFNTEEGADIVATSCLEPIDIGVEGLLGVEQYPGFAMYPLGGHTPGSTLFVVADGDRLLLFSGDITNNKSDLLNNKDKGPIYSYLLVPESTSRTAQLRLWLREMNGNDDMEVVVAHDSEDMAQILQRF